IGTFSLTANVTDYKQGWDAAYSRDLHIDVEGKGRSLTGAFEREFGALSFAGLEARNVKLQFGVTLQSNETANDYSSNVLRSWIQRGRTGWEATFMDDWCRTITSGTENTICYDGGYGDRDLKDDLVQ